MHTDVDIGNFVNFKIFLFLHALFMKDSNKFLKNQNKQVVGKCLSLSLSFTW
jgi:hypothetical protein